MQTYNSSYRPTETFTYTPYPLVKYYNGYVKYSTDPLTPKPPIFEFNTSSRILATFTGLGMPSINTITSGSPNMDGRVYEGTKYGTREVTLRLRSNGCSREEYWKLREEMIAAFRPRYHLPMAQSGYSQALGFNAFSTGEGQLRIDRVDGKTFALDCICTDGMPFMPRDLDSWDEFGFEEDVVFTAHSPFLYDPAYKLITLPNVVDGQILDISYKGTAPTFPLIIYDNGPSPSAPQGYTPNHVFGIESLYPEIQGLYIQQNPLNTGQVLIDLKPGRKRVLRGDPNGIPSSTLGRTLLEEPWAAFSEFSIGPIYERHGGAGLDEGLNRWKFTTPTDPTQVYGFLNNFQVRVYYYERYTGM